jgi:transcriptional regulator with XRE-family HTH domain
MRADQVAAIGIRIAELRKIHGRTQQALAVRAGVSVSLLRKVERGERAATHSVVAAVARALSVNVTDITGQPYEAYNAAPGSEQADVPALREALVEGDDPDLEVPTRSIDDLRTALADIKQWDRQARHVEVVRTLPDVLRHLHRSDHEVPVTQRPVVQELLAAAYCYGLVALYRLGHLDLSHLADERARSAASHSDDPLWPAVAQWHHALILLFDGSYDAGLRALDRASDLLDQAPLRPATHAVQGAIHLRAAVIAARMTNADRAEDHLLAAHALARPGQDDANHYGTKFGLPNVDIHRVAIPIEFGDATKAVSRAANIRLSDGLAPSRRGHYWIDLSRGWLLHGDRQRSLAALQTARHIAPQLTRHHPQVHETIRVLAARDARSSNPLAQFAAWCGVQR